MRTLITLVIDHKKPIPELAQKIAQRAYTIDGVDDAEPQDSLSVTLRMSPEDFVALPVVEMPEAKA